MNPKEKVAKEYKNVLNPQQADLLEIIYYTDPLCCWSWGFEPQWRRLLFEYEGKIVYRYCMGGLLPGWTNYNDSVNSVSRPIQMGPVWMHAQQLTGMPIQQNIWMHDAPASSYPACIAVKCAGLQSHQEGEIYLRLLREAVMMKMENIAKNEVLFQLAEQLRQMVPSFNVELFKEDMKNDNGLEAFRKDLQEVQYHNINRFPSLVIKNSTNQAIIISGYRPYNVLIDAINQVANFKKTDQAIDPGKYREFWPFVTEREMMEITY